MTIGEAYICLVGSIWPVYITMRLLVILWKMFNFFFHSEIWNFLSFQKLFISPCCTSKARNVCFVPPRPALMNIPGCISVSNGDEGVACLKAHHAASKPLAFCPETSRPPFLPWEPRGWVLWGNFLSRDKMQSGQEVWQVGGWDILAVSEDNIEKRLRSEIMLFVLCLKVGVVEMSREKMCILESRLTKGPSQTP